MPQHERAKVDSLNQAQRTKNQGLRSKGHPQQLQIKLESPERE